MGGEFIAIEGGAFGHAFGSDKDGAWIFDMDTWASAHHSFFKRRQYNISRMSKV